MWTRCRQRASALSNQAHSLPADEPPRAKGGREAALPSPGPLFLPAEPRPGSEPSLLQEHQPTRAVTVHTATTTAHCRLQLETVTRGWGLTNPLHGSQTTHWLKRKPAKCSQSCTQISDPPSTPCPRPCPPTTPAGRAQRQPVCCLREIAGRRVQREHRRSLSVQIPSPGGFTSLCCDSDAEGWALSW